MSSEIQQLIDELISALEQTRTVNYVRMSALAFLVYDICIMFGDEVELVWKTRWSLPKACYFLARYYGLLYILVTLVFNTTSNLTITACKSYMYFISLGGPAILSTPVNLILVLRLNALYHQNKKILMLLVFVMVGELIAALYISIEAGILAVKSLYLLPFGVSFPGCLSSVPTGFTLGAWIPCLSCAAVFFLLTLIKVGQSLAEVDGKIHWKTLSLSSLSPVYQAFIRGGAIYYTLVTAGLLMALVTTILLTGPLETVGEAWLIAVYSCAGSRLVLDLRQATLRDEKGDSWKETINLEPLRVTRRPVNSAGTVLSTISEA